MRPRLAVSCRSFGHAKGTGVGPGERATCAVFIHWLYPDASIDWVSMNKHESDKILEQLRQRGEYIHPLSKVENIEEWRKDARRIARKASLRVRTIVDSDQSYVIVVDVDYEPTEIEKRAAMRAMGGLYTETPIHWDEAVEQERRAAIHVVRQGD